MNRIDRLFGILTLLQAKTYVPAGRVAEKFGISLRTVYRDIRALNEMGIPLGSEHAKGYFIVQGFFLPPLSFTLDEANALILMASLSEKFGDRTLTEHTQSALLKIRTVLKYSDKDKAEQISSNIRIWNPPDGQSGGASLSTLQKAIVNRTLLEIEYVNNSGQRSTREIEPIGISFYSDQWHLIAWCWKRKGYRDFKVRAIQKLTDKREPFRKTGHLTLDAYIKNLE